MRQENETRLVSGVWHGILFKEDKSTGSRLHKQGANYDAWAAPGGQSYTHKEKERMNRTEKTAPS